MNCSVCGTAAGPGQRFCSQCGNPLSLACPNCGAEHGPEDRFCADCGTSLLGEVPPTPVVVPTSAERRLVSVLFIDLVGFTSISEGRDPEDVRTLSTSFFELAGQVIARFGGTVDKFIGDAVMAWWGATSSQEDDAERAVRAALEVLDRVGDLGEEVGLPGLAARAGVMTGEASVGPGGNEKGLLLGDLVNSASRVQSLAEPGEVLVGSVTAQLIAGSIEVGPASSHIVKGREEPITVARALRAIAERGGRGRADILEPPFVGRRWELRLLKDMLHDTGGERHFHLVSLVGQAGIGKSRLVWEFLKYVDGVVEPIYWHEGRSPAYGDGIALWALTEMVQRRAGIQESDDAETTLRLLEESTALHIPDDTERSWVTDRLKGLLGVGSAIGGERAELFAATRSYFEHIALKGTTVLVFEDLQAADPSLLEFIEDLADWSQNHPILVVTIGRPELLQRRPDWGSGRQGFASLHIGPLPHEDMTALIEGTAPGIDRDVTSRIAEVAGGVPLFAVEMLRMITAEGRRVEDASADDLDVPQSVHAVISARLDRLPAEDRELVRDASVLGHTFTLEALTAIGEEQIDKVEKRLADLVRREVLEVVRDPRSPERGQYRWVQGLVREVAYGRIGRDDRRQLHLKAARYLRDLDDPAVAPIAAAHYLSASDGTDDLREEVLQVLHGAIERAQTLYAHEQVVALVDTALPMVEESERAALHTMAALAAGRVFDLPAADRHVEAVAALAEKDPSLLHSAIALRGHIGNETGRSESTRDMLEAHLAAYPDLDSDPDLARFGVYLARSRLLGMGNPDDTVSLAFAAMRSVERFGFLEETADALVTLGSALAWARPYQGLAIIRGACDLSRREGLVRPLLRGLLNIGNASYDPAEILSATKETVEGAKRVGERSLAVVGTQNLINAYHENLEMGPVEEAIVDPIFVNLGPNDQIMLDAGYALLHLFKGERAEADASMQRAIDSLDLSDDPQSKEYVIRLGAVFLMFDLDFAGMYREYLDYRTKLDPTMVRHYATGGVLAGALTGRADWIADELAELREMAPQPSTQAIIEFGEGMTEILNGSLESGVKTVDRAVAELSENRWGRAAATALVAAARHLPAGHADRERMSATAHNMGVAGGATGFAEWVDQAMAAP